MSLKNIKYNIASKIDNTLLKIDVTLAVVREFIRKSLEYGMRGVVLPEFFIRYARDLIPKGSMKLVSVVAFPFGHVNPYVKISEATNAIDAGADELDIVSNTSLIKSGLIDKYANEIEIITKYFKREYPGIPIKIIAEIPILSIVEISIVAEIFNKFKPDYIKTSTGYAYRGTSIGDVLYLRTLLDEEIRIKASGGIRSFEKAVNLLMAGASIVGTSTGFKIVDEAKRYEQEIY